MKFCKDCKWYMQEQWSPISIDYTMYVTELERCTHPETQELVVTPQHGQNKVTTMNNIYHLRKRVNKCGPTARWFEEKEKPIPKCEECRHCIPNIGYSPAHCAKATYNNPEMAIYRIDESLCGKYGKWFEKKETPNSLHIMGLVEPPIVKKQSWLCRLICGRKE
jgi:hypothetical protein